MSEIEWMVDRAKLYDLKQQRPNAKAPELAKEIGRSERWARKWLTRFEKHNEEDGVSPLFCSQSRARKTSNKLVSQAVVEAILDIRDNPPDGLQRIPGPETILYYLPKHETMVDTEEYLPKSGSTIWQVLVENQRIYRRQRSERKPEPLSEPMADWQVDFKSIGSVPAEEDGKKQHVVETLNIVDKGTSIAVASVPRGDYHARTAMLTLVDVFVAQGIPYTVTLDRDTRFVGSWTANEFPSAMMRFLWCLGVTPIICPPQRPQKNAYVERFNGNYKRECLNIHRPTNLEKTIQCTRHYQQHYNHERPHQGLACQNQPPRLAFPDAQTDRCLPEVVDPDGWLVFASQRLYKRRVTSNGSIKIGGYRYYVGKALVKQQVAVCVRPQTRELEIHNDTTCIKTVPIKGLYQGKMELADYVEAMLDEALAESRRLPVTRRQKQRSNN